MKNKRPVIVAMVGLVGSGKSSVARMIAGLIHAIIIRGDDVRIALREKGRDYKRVRGISEEAAVEAIKRGSNVVMDSDYITLEKRAGLLAKTKKLGAKVIFVRTHSEIDTMIQRLIKAKYDPKGFFQNAAVAVREMWRRTPHHYRWTPEGGGSFLLKNLPFKLFATIDTTDRKSWTDEVRKVANRIKNL